VFVGNVLEFDWKNEAAKENLECPQPETVIVAYYSDSSIVGTLLDDKPGPDSEPNTTATFFIGTSNQ
jgi:hypothetical protein